MSRTYIIVLVAIAVGVAAILSMYGDSSSYVSFEEADALKREVHVVGQLVYLDSMQYQPLKNPNYFSFFLQDEKGETKKIIYYNAKPQDFDKSEKVVVVGKMENENFVASNILLKCPSKYEAEIAKE
ncbi:MAG: cytochrome c maturation protein CcmE [Bacteroidota bacterium]|nr:cytochrome c maturation protein CcmE [Bacteroidota bacterium]